MPEAGRSAPAATIGTSKSSNGSMRPPGSSHQRSAASRNSCTSPFRKWTRGMNVNFPNRAPVVVREHEVRVIRRLPGIGDVKIRSPERIDGSQVLVRTDPKLASMKISVAEQFGVPPQDVAKYLMKPIGSTFGSGEVLARNRKGLRNVVVAVPASGTLVSIDDSGTAHIAPGGGADIVSMIAGDVEFVDGKQAVSIRSVGSRLYGIVGLGPDVRGTLRFAAGSPSEELQASKISQECAGAIVVGGAWASAGVIKKLIEVKAAGLITGGMLDREVLATAGVAADDRLAPWRLSPGDEAIGQGFNPRIAIMATEGFGQLPMHAEAWSLLKELEGQAAVLLAATRLVGYLSRPSLIVVNADMLDEDAPADGASLRNGTMARLVDQSSLAQPVIMAGGPRRVRRGDGNMVEVVDVETANGQTRTVPLANVEIIG